MKKISLLLICLLTTLIINAQSDSVKVVEKPIKVKKGWKFGIALPAIAFDSDVGFKYGGLVYFYNYGDGTIYPNYLKSLYLEWSRTTKGSGINTLIYDDKKFLGKNIRYIGAASYYIEQALDFYGFNGYQAEYNSSFSNIESPDYLSRMYYRYDRRLWKFVSDFQKPIIDNKLKAYAGLSLFIFNINSVDINKLNEGKLDADKLPSVDSIPGLYENYIKWGVIPENQMNGGVIGHFKTGVIWDTRDLEACPTKGLWTEALLIYSPAMFGNKYGYSQFNFTHRQYFNIFKEKILFAYRLSYNAKLTGKMPFYIMPFYQNTFEIKDGFGGAKTIRGIMRNRVVGDGVTFGNAELRCKILDIHGKMDFYIALSGFVDAGMVTQKYKFEQNSTAPNLIAESEGLHVGYGGGIRFGVNTNSIVAIDYGRALRPEDGTTGLYIALGWLF